MKRTRLTALLACALVHGPLPSARGGDVVCYACAPERGWASIFKAVKADLGLDILFDSRNADQALSELLAENDKPNADFAYFDVTFAIKAKEAGVLEPFRPKEFDTIPAELKDPDGAWFAVHSGTIGLFVNKDALRGAPMPTCWKDLYRPEYHGMVGYIDPSSDAVGYVSAIAVNLALGGAINHFDPVISYFKALQANGAVVPKEHSYARVISGDIPILFDYDFNAYRAKYTEKGHFEFVLPCEGSAVFPYAVGLVKNAPHRAQVERALDYIVSDNGQALFTTAHLRPARPVQIAPEVKARLLSDSDYGRARPVDWGEMMKVGRIFTDLYLAEIR